jgi:hypothetical protein
VTRRRDLAPRACAAASGVALLASLWLSWFGGKASGSLVLELGADGLHGGGLEASGWSGLNAIPIAFLLVGALATAAGRGLPALVVTLVGLVALAWNLSDLSGEVTLRWPAVAGVALAADLVLCAAWSWRAR